ncbi:MAG: lipocalin family protein [Saprospiraceae bacterium]|jgi:hypothetical protein|nr:lipocalin family protein [Saprospiraceae bacterium]MBK7465682.1 lipocalin family protein [Saprospiraceae bacterium]MBK9993892.1 lipocalin family protein [Saprospiraceae bacterium]
MKKYIAIFCFFLLFANCTEDKEMLEKIIGTWKCVNWSSKSNPANQCTDQVKFVFNADKSYASFLGTADQGSFFISNKMLTVKPKDKLTFSVKIESVSKDSMLFIMNSAGDIEYLQLIKE